MTRTYCRSIMCLALGMGLLLASTTPSRAYAVLTHRAIIDYSWRHMIKPHLHVRFPDKSDKELEDAKAYAYGGAIIQDLGYFPFSSTFYSDLTHYVRTGDFVRALLKDADEKNDLAEYTFALGALEHYVADCNGHSKATNRAVAVYFPNLDPKRTGIVTYEDDHTSHSRAEFGFDVSEVVKNHYPSNVYYDRVGFKVPKALLERAFKETYGIEMKDIFHSVDVSISVYSDSVQELIPAAAQIAWSRKSDEIKKNHPEGITREQFLIKRSRLKPEDRPLGYYKRPNLMARLLAFVFRIVPNRGPFSAFNPILPSEDPDTSKNTERMFWESRIATHEVYKTKLEDIQAKRIELPNMNFDTGQLTKRGDYRSTDETYAKLLRSLAAKKFKDVSPELRGNILDFFATPAVWPVTKEEKAKWATTMRALEQLKSTPAEMKH